MMQAPLSIKPGWRALVHLLMILVLVVPLVGTSIFVSVHAEKAAATQPIGLHAAPGATLHKHVGGQAAAHLLQVLSHLRGLLMQQDWTGPQPLQGAVFALTPPAGLPVWHLVFAIFHPPKPATRLA